MIRLSAQECRRFAAAYLRGLDADEGAAAIGRDDGAALLERADVQRAIRRARRRLPQKNDVIRRLAQLAFGRSNDCVKFALGDGVDVDALDLTLLSEIRRTERGAVEVRLLDRLEALRQLAALCDSNEDAADFFRAMEEDGG